MEEEKEKTFTVSEVNKLIKKSIDNDFKKTIMVVGEVSNFKISKNNLFMNLKDRDGIINVICWNYISRFKDLDIENGNNVTITGYINMSTKYGNFSLIAIGFEVDGTGDLHKEYELIKKKCEKDGFFDTKTKLKLPENINKIGVITALGGAALKDFLYVLEHGNYKGKVYVKGCNVQGKECPTTVINCLEEMDKMDLDVIIITRGGGSFEDLFGFSDYGLLEKLYKTKTCTISAIGHEIDFMLSDFVADIRAPTPSIAGEIIYKHQQNLYDLQKYKDFLESVRYNIGNKFNKYRLDLIKLEQKLVPYDKILDNCNKDINDFYKNANIKLENRLSNIKDKLNNLISKLDNANPTNILEMGYVLLLNPETNNTITSVNELKNIGKKLNIQFKDGSATIALAGLDILDD